MNLETAITGYGLIFIGGLFAYGITRGIRSRVLPVVRVVRRGRAAAATVVELKMPSKPGYRTTRPILQFAVPDGRQVRFQDLNAQNCGKQSGDQVTVHYDPVDPEGTATMLGKGDALRFLRTATLSGLVPVGLMIVGLLILIGVIPFGT